MFIVDNFLFGQSDGIKDEQSFLESGIIDSTGILELVAFLEQTYGVEVKDEEMVPENLDSLTSIAGFLRFKLGDQVTTKVPGA